MDGTLKTVAFIAGFTQGHLNPCPTLSYWLRPIFCQKPNDSTINLMMIDWGGTLKMLQLL